MKNAENEDHRKVFVWWLDVVRRLSAADCVWLAEVRPLG